MMPIPTDRLGGKTSTATGKAKATVICSGTNDALAPPSPAEMAAQLTAIRDALISAGMSYGASGHMPDARWQIGNFVRKTRGSSWRGRVCGFYATKNTPIGYAVESLYEPGSVQVWPEAALEDWNPEHKQPDLVDALIKLDELAHRELMSVRPETENRETYKDGFFSGVVALAGKIRDAIRKIADIDSAVTTADLTPAPLTDPQSAWWSAADFQIGAVFEGIDGGMWVLERLDVFHGEQTLVFGNGGSDRRYKRVDQLDQFLKPPKTRRPGANPGSNVLPDSHLEIPMPPVTPPKPAAETRGNIVKRLMADGCWTPYNLEVLLHHYSSRAPFPRADAPAYPGCIAKLQREALMNEDKTLSDAGVRLIEALCRTPAL